MTNKIVDSGKQIKSIIKKNTRYLIGITLLSIVTASLSALNPLFYKKIIDEAIPEKNKTLLLICIILMALIPLVNVLISNLRQRCGFKFSDNCEKELRGFYFEKILRMNYPGFVKIGPTKLMSVITRSIGQISALYLKTDVISGTANLVQLLVIFGILFYYNKAVAIATFAVVPVIYFIIKLFTDKIGNLQGIKMSHMNNLEKFLLQVFNGMKTVRSYSGQEKEINNLNEWMNTNTALGWKIERTNITVRQFVPVAVSEIVLGCIFAACAFSVMKDTMTLGTLVAVISYVPMLITSIQNLLGLQVGKASIAKIINDLDSILEETPEYDTNDNSERIDGQTIAFKNVDFTYGRESFDLKIEDLELEKGDFITIVGNTGGGKSSIMDIINKFYPVSVGNILFDKKDINAIGTSTLRKNIGTMFQDVYMFNGTIAENIAYPNQPDFNKINEVVSKAQLADFVNRLPNKLNEVIEENGSNFSGGECQRMALARMLYKDADIMLLDEPTAALDAGTSKAIFDMLHNENKSNNKTIIAITHDAGKALYGNKVMVVNNGRIVEFGSPDELINQGGAFASLYNAQIKMS